MGRFVKAMHSEYLTVALRVPYSALCNAGAYRHSNSVGMGETVFTKPKVLNHYQDLKKAEFFGPLPEHLSEYEKWLPALRLVDGSVGALMILLRPKHTATVAEMAEWKRNAQSLPALWWTSVLIPALQALPRSSRTRRHNAVDTTEETLILPTYLRLYEDDVPALDGLLAGRGLADFNWFFYCCKFGQRKLLETGQSLGPGSFGLDDGFDLTSALLVSLHLALNFGCVDTTCSLFWSFDETRRWMSGESPLTIISMYNPNL